MSDVIERAARAVLAEHTESMFDIFHARVYARAVIEAMRDCTPEMLDAGSAAHPAGGYVRGTLLTDIIEAEWWAMCDAALSIHR